MNELLLELSEQIPAEAGRQFLDLGTADVLEEQLKHLINGVDELNQVKWTPFRNKFCRMFLFPVLKINTFSGIDEV